MDAPSTEPEGLPRLQVKELEQMKEECNHDFRGDLFGVRRCRLCSVTEDAVPGFRFDGETYDHERDGARLTGQHGRVWSVLSDGEWHTLSDIARSTGDPEASVSARLRDLRKPKFGAHNVNREYVKSGLHRYQLIQKV